MENKRILGREGIGSPLEMLLGMGPPFYPRQTDHLCLSKDTIRISEPMTYRLYGLKSKDETRRSTADKIGITSTLDKMCEEKENKEQHALAGRNEQALLTDQYIMNRIQGAFLSMSVPLIHCSATGITTEGKVLPADFWTVKWPEKCKLARELVQLWPVEVGMKVLKEAYDALTYMDSEREELEQRFYGEKSRVFPIYTSSSFTPQSVERFVGSSFRELELFMVFRRKAFQTFTSNLWAKEKLARAEVVSLRSSISDMEISAAKNGIVSGEWGRVPAPPPPPPPRKVGRLPAEMLRFRYECLWVTNGWFRGIASVNAYLASTNKWQNCDELLAGISNLTNIMKDVRKQTFQIYVKCLVGSDKNFYYRLRS